MYPPVQMSEKPVATGNAILSERTSCPYISGKHWREPISTLLPWHLSFPFRQPRPFKMGELPSIPRRSRLVWLSMVVLRPIVLSERTELFDDPQWLFELKYDGWRALAVIPHGWTGFLSRKGSWLNTFSRLAETLSRILHIEDAILDGEIAVPDETGRTVFAKVMHHRDKPRFYAFDLLRLNGEDLRSLPLGRT